MRRAIVVTLVLVCAACSLSSEDNFIQGARKDPCDNSIPVCSYTAGCRLTEGENYFEGAFPGFHSFVVPTACSEPSFAAAAGMLISLLPLPRASSGSSAIGNTSRCP